MKNLLFGSNTLGFIFAHICLALPQRCCFATTTQIKKNQDKKVKKKQFAVTYTKAQSLPKLPKLSNEVKDIQKKVWEAEPSKSDEYMEILQTMTPQTIYQKMDSSFEGFFMKRPYNINNFNFLLQVLADQKKFDQSIQTLDKMKTLNIVPNVVTYNQLIKVCGRVGKVKQAEQFFEEAKQKFDANIFLYTSLINCYVRNKTPSMATKILREITSNKMIPDCACLTTVINAYYKASQLDECWNLFELYKKDGALSDRYDANIFTLMIEIAAHVAVVLESLMQMLLLLSKRHEAEKGKLLLKQMESLPNFVHTTMTYNAVIKCLGSRRDYANEATQFYHKMIIEGTTPDSDTIVHILKACSNIGDIQTAYNALQIMKNQKIPPSKYIYNEMLRTYAGACNLKPLPEDTKDLYIKDAWKLIDQIKAENLINNNILNSFLYIHVKAVRKEQIEGIVLPLYDKFQIQKDAYTYQHLMELYSGLKDMQIIYRLYQSQLQDKLEPTWPSLNYVLDSAIRSEDVKMIVEVLQKFQKINREPKPVYLKRLGQSDHLPLQIHAELMQFKTKFGKAKIKSLSTKPRPQKK